MDAILLHDLLPAILGLMALVAVLTPFPPSHRDAHSRHPHRCGGFFNPENKP